MAYSHRHILIIVLEANVCTEIEKYYKDPDNLERSLITKKTDKNLNLLCFIKKLHRMQLPKEAEQ